jgi:hypothetical protein
MKAVVALLLAALAFSPASFAQEKKKPVPKKVQKKAEKKPAAGSSGDWSNFNSSGQRNLKADEEKRKAKAARK